MMFEPNEQLQLLVNAAQWLADDRNDGRAGVLSRMFLELHKHIVDGGALPIAWQPRVKP